MISRLDCRMGGAALAALLIVSGAQAADLGSRSRAVEATVAEAADVPGGDIFGFTSGTDVGKVGDRGLALESSGAYGISAGRYHGLSQKLELSATLVENWSFAASLFGAWTSLRNSPDFNDRSAYGFDGVSFEVRHRVIERSATNPFAVTLAIEPRWARLDGVSGLRAPAYGAEFKLQIDAPVADRLYWAANANFATGRSRDPLDLTWSTSSDTSLSTALAYEAIKEKLFVGAEARWQQAWSKGFFGSVNGQAVYLGPTIAWAARENVMINAVFLPQIAGKARGASGPFDLDNFNRANYRVKIAVGF
ncbi:MAG: hypothetical protein JWN07_1285 [Hyphomicrobiales bacterium]|nr:hypothetical protein [Hyphomicrobiales bacterium]